jgi:zinc transport system ATP-binding protein
MKLLVVDGLSMKYHGADKPAVENVSFSVNTGEVVSVLGANGSGKTTVMRGLAGLAEPYRGTIEYAPDVRIGFLPQDTEHIPNFPATVYEIVISGCLSGKTGLFHNKADREKANNALAALSITELRNRQFSALSGGAKQKALLARALCSLFCCFECKAEKGQLCPHNGSHGVLLLDEPTSALDTESRREFYDIISSLKKCGLGVVIISHDTENSVRYSDKILCIHETEHFFGTTHEYLHHNGGCECQS